MTTKGLRFGLAALGLTTALTLAGCERQETTPPPPTPGNGTVTTAPATLPTEGTTTIPTTLPDAMGGAATAPTAR